MNIQVRKQIVEQDEQLLISFDDSVLLNSSLHKPTQPKRFYSEGSREYLDRWLTSGFQTPSQQYQLYQA